MKKIFARKTNARVSNHLFVHHYTASHSNILLTQKEQNKKNTTKLSTEGARQETKSDMKQNLNSQSFRSKKYAHLKHVTIFCHRKKNHLYLRNVSILIIIHIFIPLISMPKKQYHFISIVCVRACHKKVESNKKERVQNKKRTQRMLMQNRKK